MNMTTPINQKLQRLIESEDFKNMNTNINTQQSFSSFLTNWNFAKSNGSSFQMNEENKQKNLNNFDKKIIQTVPTGNNNNGKNLLRSSTFNTGIILGNTVHTDSNISNSNNYQTNDLHAKSVEFTNKSPLQISKNSNGVFPNYMSLNQYVNNGDFDQSNTNTIHNNMFNGNFKSQNNMAQYSICQDNNVYYKGYYENYNNLNKIHSNNICPIKFNPNDDKNILDNVLILIKDQNGCRLIQKKLEDRREDFLLKFYEKVYSSILHRIDPTLFV